MKNEVHEQLVNHVQEILGDRRPNKIATANDVLQYWKNNQSDIEAIDFSNALIEVAYAVMMHHESLDETLIFAQHMKERARRCAASISEYWPPVDHNQWPSRKLKGEGQ